MFHLNIWVRSEIDKVSEILNVKNLEVQNMESRLSGGDLYLNQKIDNESDNDLMSLLNDDRPNPEEVLNILMMESLKKILLKKQFQL